MPTVVGRKEADDIAVPVAAIENVIPIDHDIFGSIEFADADTARSRSIFVLRVRRV